MSATRHRRMKASPHNPYEDGRRAARTERKRAKHFGQVAMHHRIRAPKTWAKSGIPWSTYARRPPIHRAPIPNPCTPIPWPPGRTRHPDIRCASARPETG